MTDYTGTTIKLPQEVALSLDQQLTRQHKVNIKTTLINHIHVHSYEENRLTEFAQV